VTAKRAALPWRRHCGARIAHAGHLWEFVNAWSGTVREHRCPGTTRHEAAVALAEWRAEDPRKDIVR
jgi:hypothetical protein